MTTLERTAVTKTTAAIAKRATGAIANMIDAATHQSDGRTDETAAMKAKLASAALTECYQPHSVHHHHHQQPLLLEGLTPHQANRDLAWKWR